MEQPNLAMIPSGYKARVVYSIMPENGVGDFTFVRSGDATRINKDGLIETVDSHVPRLNYDLVNGAPSQCPSLLLEPQRTNIITNSNSSNLNFSLDQTSMTYNQIVSPEGLNNGILLQQTGSASSNSAYNYGLTTTDGTYTYSIFIKAKDSTKMRFYSSNGVVLNQEFNPQEMTEGVVSGSLNLKFKDYGNGWFRVSFSRTLSSASTHRLIIYPDRNNTQKGVYIYGLQVEVGSYPTSYIPTSGSTITRSAEACDEAGNASTFNSEQGILFAEIAALANDNTFRMMCICDGTNNNSVNLQFKNTDNTIRTRIESGGVAQVDMDSTVLSALNFNKIAVKFKANDFALWINGNEAITDTSGSTPLGLNELKFDNGSGNHKFYGKFKDLRYYDTEGMTDTEIDNLLTQLTQ